MKRFLALMAVCVFLSIPARSQDTVPATNCPELSIIPRIDANPFSPYVYSILDGDIGKHLSYSASNVWVSDDTPSLYANTCLAKELDWCQWAYLSLNLGNWHISGGKQAIAVGSFECDEYDFDQYWQMCTNFWNSYQLYQFGGSVSYDTPSENTTFTLQLASAPLYEHPFDNGAKTVSFKWAGEYGIYSALWSAAVMNYKESPAEKNDQLALIIAGNKFDITDNLAVGLDWFFHSSLDERNNHDNFANSFAAFVKWQPAYWIDVTLKGILEKSAGKTADFFDVPENYLNGGVCFQFYPIRSCEGLRLHALAGSNNIDGFFWSTGITYKFNLTQTLLNRKSK